jgi:hypothetical protein
MGEKSDENDRSFQYLGRPSSGASNVDILDMYLL